MLTDFQKNFTHGLSRDRVMNWSLKVPSHLRGVDTLPCEIQIPGNYRQSETNVSFNNKFQLNLLQLIMFLLIYVTVNIKIVIM